MKNKFFHKGTLISFAAFAFLVLNGCGGGGVSDFLGDGGSRLTITGQMLGQTKVVCVNNLPSNLNPAQIQDVFKENATKAFRWDSGATLESKIESDRSCGFNLTPFVTVSWEKFANSSGNQQLVDWGSFVAKIDTQGKKTVDVCLRDTQCEDGDVLDITVNGTPFLRYEIKTERACFSVPVSTGRNYIGVYAVNGTGFKGNCDFSDINTGEVTVLGQGNISRVQTYRVAGGQGSYGELVITN